MLFAINYSLPFAVGIAASPIPIIAMVVVYASGQRRRLYEFRLCGLGHLTCGLPAPGQQFFDAFGGMIGDAGEDIGEPGAWI